MAEHGACQEGMRAAGGAAPPASALRRKACTLRRLQQPLGPLPARAATHLLATVGAALNSFHEKSSLPGAFIPRFARSLIPMSSTTTLGCGRCKAAAAAAGEGQPGRLGWRAMDTGGQLPTALLSRQLALRRPTARSTSRYSGSVQGRGARLPLAAASAQPALAPVQQHLWHSAAAALVPPQQLWRLAAAAPTWCCVGSPPWLMRHSRCAVRSPATACTMGLYCPK